MPQGAPYQIGGLNFNHEAQTFDVTCQPVGFHDISPVSLDVFENGTKILHCDGKSTNGARQPYDDNTSIKFVYHKNQ